MILVTGATGFVGRAVVAAVARQGRPVRGAVRRLPQFPVAGAHYAVGADLLPGNDWTALLSGVETVVHTAARVHVMMDAASDPLTEFRRVNVAGTLNVARQAARAGVRRFVFISSIKVNGERTVGNRPFLSTDVPAPADPYGISKHEAEIELRSLGRATGVDIVIIRPPLIYGPGVKANLANLVRAVARGIPLPFGAIHNKRSLIGLDNLTSFITRTLEYDAAIDDTFLVSDGDDMSTPELVRRIAMALGRRPRLVPVPPWVLAAGAVLVRKGDVARRLLDSLMVDSSAARAALGWRPPLTVDEGLTRLVASLSAGGGAATDLR